MKLYQIDIEICATAYIKAENEHDAMVIATNMQNAAPDILDSEGEIPISGLRYDDPDLPNVSLSPAMTIQGVWHGATAEEV